METEPFGVRRASSAPAQTPLRRRPTRSVNGTLGSYVTPNNVPNICPGAGISQPVVGSFPSSAVNVMRMVPFGDIEGATWVKIQNPSGGTGWVNSLYLTEYVTQDALCADPRIPALIDQLKGSANQSNGELFSALVSPVHGVDAPVWVYASPVNFTSSAARSVFNSTAVYDRGGGPSGQPDSGTFSQVIQPKMQEVFNEPNLETYCDSLMSVFPLSMPWPYPNIRYYDLSKPASG